MSAITWFLRHFCYEAIIYLWGGWEDTLLVHVAGSGQASKLTEHILYWVE